MVDFPSRSFQVSSCRLQDVCKGKVASWTTSFTLAASTFLAKPSEMDWAICNAVVPASYLRMLPSGKETARVVECKKWAAKIRRHNGMRKRCYGGRCDIVRLFTELQCFLQVFLNGTKPGAYARVIELHIWELTGNVGDKTPNFKNLRNMDVIGCI